MLAFAIPVLVHHPSFTNYQDRAQLKQIEKGLRFILEPLMSKPDAFSFNFYKHLIEMMKDHCLNIADDNEGNTSNLVS